MDNKEWLKNMLGGNGNGHKPNLAAEMKQLQKDLEDVSHMLDELALDIDGRDMNARTSGLVEGFGAHIKPDGLWQTLVRRGSSHRLLAPLADRILEFQGWGKLHLQAAALQADMAPMIAFKVLSISVRLDKIQQVLGATSDETQELMVKVLEGLRGHLLQISHKLMENFGADADTRLIGPSGS